MQKSIMEQIYKRKNKDQVIENYGEIRTYLTKMGRPIVPNDLIIASIAKSNQVILVTNNSDEFARIPDLHLEDWLL